ncbi:MAG: zinc transporter ZupT [Planctomycetota bacterium]
MSVQTVLTALGLTFLAGLSTGIGSALAFFAKRTNTRLLSAALGFSAGVMIYVSFVEIFTKAKDCLAGQLGQAGGYWATTGAFFGGMALIALIDKLVPSFENPHEVHRVEEMKGGEPTEGLSKLYRVGLFTAIAIAIHNFPEGFATFASALRDPKLGIAIATAIAIHNIPEGIAVSVPIFYATGSKKKAFAYSFLSGLSEPLGAVIGYAVLFPFFNDIIFGALFASVGGIMVFISLDELIPTAERYGHHHHSIYGLGGISLAPVGSIYCAFQILAVAHV